MSRKLVTLRQISGVTPITGADKIECAHVDGWACVVKKGEFNVGDTGVYFEVDSFLPASDPRFSFLGTPTTFEGTEGYRLRTIRLRGQISQGLLLPLADFPDIIGTSSDDLADALHVVKWEPAIPADLGGAVIGPFPNYIPKSDQERIQNLSVEQIANEITGHKFEITVKLDGTSMTVFRNNDEVGVCGRNWRFKPTTDNTLNNVAKRDRLLEALVSADRNIALQGELIGPGIQGNNEKLAQPEFYVYNIFDIDEQRWFTPRERHDMIDEFELLGFIINHVPVVEYRVIGNTSVQEFIDEAEGPSLNIDSKREGLVYKRMDGQFQFKVVSNSYLLKHGDR